MTTDTFALFRFGYGSVFHVPISCVWACFDGKRYLSTKVFLIRSFAREFSLVFFQFGRYSFSNMIQWVLKFTGRRKRRRQTSSSCKYQISKCLSCKFSYYAFKKTEKRIVKFKNQLTLEIFAVVNYLSGSLRKQKFTSAGSKGHALWFDWWISIHFVCSCVSGFFACDHNYNLRQRKTQL